MDLLDLLPLTVPAVLIVGVAVRSVAVARRDTEVVVDLRDVPIERLAPAPGVTAPTVPGPVRGGLEPAGAGTLGERLRSADAPVLDEVAAPTTRVVAIRRRRRPLVAVSRESATR